MIYIALSLDGVPTHAVCCDCNQKWERPAGDPDGRTFRSFVAAHIRSGQRHSEMWLVGIHKT